ncbi:MAG: universal stress protein [Burkholderiales bacterium]|nr:universal stress protein [Burkholderiales bacterium]
MTKTLVPVDGSKASLEGVRHAIERARAQPDTLLYLVNVQPALGRYVGRFLGARAAHGAMVERGRRALDEAERIESASGVAVRSIVLRGRIEDAVRRLIDEEGVNEIVLGAATKSPVLRILTGSVTNRILAVASVPVSVVAAPPLSALQRYGIPGGVGLALAALIMAAEQ